VVFGIDFLLFLALYKVLGQTQAGQKGYLADQEGDMDLQLHQGYLSFIVFN
jgi:hypothetical protein